KSAGEGAPSLRVSALTGVRGPIHSIRAAARSPWVHAHSGPGLLRVLHRTPGYAQPSHPQIRLPHERATEELAARPLEHHAPGLEHVTPGREVERRRHVLLDEEHRQPLGAV